MSEKANFPLIPIVIVSVVAIICASIISGGISSIRTTSESITVTGSARKPVVSDYVVWRGSVNATGSQLSDTYRQYKKYQEQLSAFFQQQGLPDSAYSFRSPQTITLYQFSRDGGETGKVNGYRMMLQFEVRSGDLVKMEAIAQKANDLILEGLPLESYPLEYLVIKLNEYRLDLLTDATKDAKLRAERIALGTGNKVGSIRNAKVGVFQVTRRNSNEVSDYGMYDTSTKEKEIMAVVSVSFAIQ
ncbi:MAG: SIMPL domain-containing protein [bacterium]|nr:SIMPL domain-containing protein [bacterium]